MAKEIPLSRGMIAIVDDDDFERVSQYKWCLYGEDRGWYAARYYQINYKQHRVLLHHFILGIKTRTDHRNGNGLDNRKENLRVAPTDSQNKFNMGKYSNNTTGYKGVFFRQGKQGGRCYAQVRAFNKVFHLGTYDNPEDAARAYDKAAKEKHGEFAKTNFG